MWIGAFNLNEVQSHKVFLKLRIEEFSKLWEQYKEAMVEAMSNDVPVSYEEAQVNYGLPIEALREWSKTMSVKLSPLPDYGDLMTLKEFIESCKDGMFIDYDGVGHYATETEMTDIEVYPSDITNGDIQYEWTHVCWFNR